MKYIYVLYKHTHTKREEERPCNVFFSCDKPAHKTCGYCEVRVPTPAGTAVRGLDRHRYLHIAMVTPSEPKLRHNASCKPQSYPCQPGVLHIVLLQEVTGIGLHIVSQ